MTSPILKHDILLYSNLMEALGYYHEDVHFVNLGELEVALEQAISAVYWRGKSSSWVLWLLSVRLSHVLAAVRVVNDNPTASESDDFDLDAVKYSVTVSYKSAFEGMAC